MSATSIQAVSGKRPVKVMRIIARLNIGGPAIHVCLLAAGMNGDGFTSQLVTGHIGPNEGDMSYLARDYGLEPIFVPGLGRELSLVGDIRAFIALVRLMRREHPQVVHTHTAKAGFLGRLAAGLCGVPVVVHTFHGHTFRGYFGPAKSRFFIILEQLAGRLADVILTVSERLRDELISFKIAPAAKIQVIPLGLDLAGLADLGGVRGRLRTKLGVGPATPLVGIVGRLVAIKNHEMFLQAAKKVLEQMPEARFVVVGDGDRHSELQDIAMQTGLGRAVYFCGWRRDLGTIYADLDLLALTSNNEGTPVSIIEAMAAGVPVVATAVGGVPDLLQNGVLGTLVAAGDVDGLSTAVLDALRSGPKLRRLKKAQKVALEQYSSQRLVADLKDLYRTLLDRDGIVVKGG
jgi:glycosyltransferase involved in cell wall biosynthesis